MTTSVDTVIIGGGLAGLYASLLLQRHGAGSHMLLEARDRLGGRILGAGSYDLGPRGSGQRSSPGLAPSSASSACLSSRNTKRVS